MLPLSRACCRADARVFDQAAGDRPAAPGDFNPDTDVDAQDYGHFEGCTTGPALGPPGVGCDDADLGNDDDVDQADFGLLQRCFSGLGVLADPACAS